MFYVRATTWFLFDAGPSARFRGSFGAFSAQLRRDLDDDFTVFQEESRAELLQERYGEQADPFLVSDHALTQSNFARAALAGLAINGDESDRDRILRRLETDDARVRAAAIDALKRVGTEEDVPLLLSIAADTEGTLTLRRSAAGLAMRLDPVASMFASPISQIDP